VGYCFSGTVTWVVDGSGVIGYTGTVIFGLIGSGVIGSTTGKGLITS